MPTLSEILTPDWSALERYCLQDLVVHGSSVLSLRSLDNAIFASQRIPIAEFYGRSFASEYALDLAALDTLTSNQGSPVMTEVTANTAAVAPSTATDIHVRPPLPEGIRYVFDDCDRVTITDVSGAPEGTFGSADPYYCGFLYRFAPGSNFDCGSNHSDLTNVTRREADARVHLVRHPTSRDYGSNPSYSAHPAHFSFYEYGNGNPWNNLAWWKDNFLRWAEHMPAPSNKHPGLLMYFQSPEKRARDIRTPIKPGKYLMKFFSDLLTGEEINNFAVMWSNMATPPKLKVTMDADEIEMLYKGKHNGSCMHFANDGYDGDQHPARAYAGPDLAQAYIGDLECADARCLVWPDKMIYYPKYYGDYRRLEAALEDAGYKPASESSFVGARIQRIPHGKAFVAPYLDVCGYVQDRGEFLTIEFDGIPCRETEGLSRYRGRSCAYNGSTGHNEEDMTYVDNWGWVSEDAYDDHFGRCVITDDHFHRDRLTLVNDGDAFISDQVISRGHYSEQWYRCERSDEYFTDNYERRVEMSNGDTWSRTVFEREGAVCELSGENYPDDETTILDNGKVVADDRIDEEDEDYRVFAGLDVSDNEDDAEIREAEAA